MNDAEAITTVANYHASPSAATLVALWNKDTAQSSASGHAKLAVWGVENNPSSGAFEKLDTWLAAGFRIKNQALNLRRTTTLSYRNRLSARLLDLLEALEDEGDEWEDDSPESLRRMLLFLYSRPEYTYPTVTVTPSATFRAQWHGDNGELLALDFQPTGWVKFVVYCPDASDGSIETGSGVVGWHKVMERVSPYRVSRWTTERNIVNTLPGAAYG